ncbi:MAG TPA: hypothetical protein VG106_00305, partial [Vicinamibacterales bacterium]|nr:hypothetical protein [Vicinamibacterales bacterium]
MRAPIAALVLYLAIAPFAHAGPRITFERVLPAPHDLGDAEAIALVHAIGDHVKIESFVDHFVHQANRSGFLHVRDARGEKERRADVLLSVKTFTCESRDGGGDVGVTDIDGNRVRRRHVWIDAMCVARIDVTAGKQKSTFYAKGEGTSPRVEELSDDVRNIAFE